jgi:hypothetical protein
MKKDFRKKKAGSSVQMIAYSDALAAINVDLGEAAVRDEIKWGVSTSS